MSEHYVKRQKLPTLFYAFFLDLCMRDYVNEFDLLNARLCSVKYLRFMKVLTRRI